MRPHRHKLSPREAALVDVLATKLPLLTYEQIVAGFWINDLLRNWRERLMQPPTNVLQFRRAKARMSLSKLVESGHLRSFQVTMPSIGNWVDFDVPLPRCDPRLVAKRFVGNLHAFHNVPALSRDWRPSGKAALTGFDRARHGPEPIVRLVPGRPFGFQLHPLYRRRLPFHLAARWLLPGDKPIRTTAYSATTSALAQCDSHADEAKAFRLLRTAQAEWELLPGKVELLDADPDNRWAYSGLTQCRWAVFDFADAEPRTIVIEPIQKITHWFYVAEVYLSFSERVRERWITPNCAYRGAKVPSISLPDAVIVPQDPDQPPMAIAVALPPNASVVTAMISKWQASRQIGLLVF